MEIATFILVYLGITAILIEIQDEKDRRLNQFKYRFAFIFGWWLYPLVWLFDFRK